MTSKKRRQRAKRRLYELVRREKQRHAEALRVLELKYFGAEKVLHHRKIWRIARNHVVDYDVEYGTARVYGLRMVPLQMSVTDAVRKLACSNAGITKQDKFVRDLDIPAPMPVFTHERRQAKKISLNLQ